MKTGRSKWSPFPLVLITPTVISGYKIESFLECAPFSLIYSAHLATGLCVVIIINAQVRNTH